MEFTEELRDELEKITEEYVEKSTEELIEKLKGRILLEEDNISEKQGNNLAWEFMIIRCAPKEDK